MNEKKQLGIWMDHSNAHVLEYSKNFGTKKIIESKKQNNSDNGSNQQFAFVKDFFSKQ